MMFLEHMTYQPFRSVVHRVLKKVAFKDVKDFLNYFSAVVL